MTPPRSSSEEALAQHLAEQVRAEISRDVAALKTFIDAHGSFAEMVREHYATADGDSPFSDGPAGH